MDKLASVDIGTHSTRILVGTVKDGKIEEIERHTNITKLGEGISDKRIIKEALDRTLKVLAAYGELIKQHEVSKVTVFTTSAVRDAQNKEEFSLAVEKAVGVRPRVITGQEEASLTFKGVCSALDDPKYPLLAIDIGGGSTEFAGGYCSSEPFAVSLDVGCLRMKEAYFEEMPPSNEDIMALSEFVKQTILKAKIGFFGKAKAYAVAGTSTSLMAIKLGLEPYDRSKVHMQKLTKKEVSELASRLAKLSIEELKMLPGLQPDRAEVILPGALILEQIMGVFDLRSVTVSEYDILDGALMSIA